MTFASRFKVPSNETSCNGCKRFPVSHSASEPGLQRDVIVHAGLKVAGAEALGDVGLLVATALLRAVHLHVLQLVEKALEIENDAFFSG